MIASAGPLCLIVNLLQYLIIMFNYRCAGANYHYFFYIANFAHSSGNL